MRRYLGKSLSTVFSLLIFALLTTGVHEQGHYLAAECLAIKGGKVTYGFFSGCYYYPDGIMVALWQDIIVGLAGGVFTGVLLLILWYLAHFQTKYTEWETDDAFSLQVLMLMQFIYSPFDAVGHSYVYWGGPIGMAIGFVVACLVYGKKLLAWLAED